MRKDVELRVKGTKDPSVDRSVDSSVAALKRLAAAQKATASRREALQAARDAKAAYQEQTRAASDLARQIEATSRPSRRLKTEFEQAKAAARQAKTEFQAKRAALQGLSSTARGSFSAFDRIATALRQEALAARTAAAAHDRAAGAARRHAAANRQLAGGADLAEQQTEAWSTRHGRGPLGLRPYELQNLGYQINDLITQIASGTPIMQAFAQQGGQIAQLFPRAIAAVLRFTPVIAALTAVLTPVVAVFRNINDEAASLREFSATLAASADGALHSSEAMARAAHRLDVLGGSLKDARAAVAAFNREGIDDTYLVRFGVSAENMARVFGTEVPEAAERVARAFSGTYEDVKALDDAINFLTLEERRHIREMFESGRAAEARTEAFRIFEQRMDEGAQKARGPWSRSIRNLAEAWDNFLSWLADTGPIRTVIQLVDSLASKLVNLTQRLRDAAGGAEGDGRRLMQINQRLWEIENVAAPGAPSTSSFGARSRGELLQEAERLRRERARILARFDPVASGDPRTDGSNRAAKAEEDRRLEEEERRRRGAEAAARRAAQEAERLAERQRDFVAGLEAENAARRFQLALLDETERESRILTAIRDAENDAARVGLELTEAQRAAIRQTVGDLYDAQQAQRANELIERARLQLAERRGEVESRADFIARQTREAGIDLLTEQGRIYADIQGQLYDIIQQERKRNAAERAVTDALTRQRELQQQIQFARDSGNFATAGVLEEQLQRTNAELREAIENAIAFWTAMGGPEAEAAILRLQGLLAQTDALGTNIIVTADQINEMLAEGATSAFDRLFDGLAEGKNLIEAMRDSFLQFAADFLRQISLMIFKQMILNALMGTGGGGGVGGKISGAIQGIFGGGGGAPVKVPIKAPVKHGGGIIGAAGSTRQVSPAWFRNAMRYHNGGIVGFAPNEVPAILERGEEVLTADDPRHARNGGGAARLTAKVINVLDPADLLDKGLATEAGEQVFWNFVTRNRDAFRAIVAT